MQEQDDKTLLEQPTRQWDPSCTRPQTFELIQLLNSIHINGVRHVQDFRTLEHIQLLNNIHINGIHHVRDFKTLGLIQLLNSIHINGIHHVQDFKTLELIQLLRRGLSVFTNVLRGRELHLCVQAAELLGCLGPAAAGTPRSLRTRRSEAATPRLDQALVACTACAALRLSTRWQTE